jgi:hypothetical protein
MHAAQPHLDERPDLTVINNHQGPRMTNLERLRLSTALAHVVPGATLHLSCHSGEVVNVGAHPTADIDACALRKVVIASACRTVPDYSELVRDIKVCGSLQHIGGGVHRRVVGEVEQRWIATSPSCSTTADRTAYPTTRCMPA